MNLPSVRHCICYCNSIVQGHLRLSEFPRSRAPGVVTSVRSQCSFRPSYPLSPKSFSLPPARVPCPPSRLEVIFILALGMVARHMNHGAERVVFNTVSRCGGLSVRGVSSECHFRIIFHTIALPKSGVLILAISRFSMRTDSLLIALERDLDVTRCNVLYCTVLFFSVRSRTQLPRSIFPRARSWRGLTETVANPEILYTLSNESAGKGMHGIICDGGASKFSCLVEWLNLVRRGLSPDAKCRAFGGSVARSKTGPGRGVGKATNNGLHFRGICAVIGSVAWPKINRNKGTDRAYEKTSLTVRSHGLGRRWKYGGDTS